MCIYLPSLPRAERTSSRPPPQLSHPHANPILPGARLFDVGLVSLAIYGLNVASIVTFAFATFKLKRISGLTMRSLGAAADGEDGERSVLISDSDGDEQLPPRGTNSSSGLRPPSFPRGLLGRWQTQSMPALLAAVHATCRPLALSPRSKTEPLDGLGASVNGGAGACGTGDDLPLDFPLLEVPCTRGSVP